MPDIHAEMADGLWIVKTDQYSHGKTLIAKICDLPDEPYNFASIMCKHDDLCKFMGRFNKEYAEKHNGWCPSRSELAKGILLYLAGRAGHTKRTQRKRPSRRIEFTL